jgi:hypothetical protein
MKMKPEHYAKLSELVAEVIDRHGPERLAAYADTLRAAPGNMDVAMRFRWDIWYCVAPHYRLPLMDDLYVYLHDAHIDTALRNLVSLPEPRA